jgi:NAD dependent epimerase/dehydratase
VSTLAGKRVLVTGAGGFVGSHLVERLVCEGAEVRALVHYNSRNDWGRLEWIPREVRDAIEVVAGEIQDGFSVSRAVAGREIVFHLAALIGIPYSYIAPKSYIDTNVLGTLNMLEAARSAEVERFLQTSTSEIYGTARYTPIDEDHPLQGQSPYSASKIGAEKLAESYARSFAMPITIVRPFNTFGPRQSLRAVIPTIISQALAGDPIRLGSTTPIRDFTFVEDTARAFTTVASTPATIEMTVNVGAGQSITIGALAELILDVTGSDVPLMVDDQRIRPEASEVLELRCDATRLREVTGWAPAVSLREGLERTVAWMRERPLSSRTTAYAV